ncbi:MAG TPA: hypothetical protein VD866_06535 [Urbifossiella sp.]|nr:hypothetical protein [Urbifossiella sp.]
MAAPSTRAVVRDILSSNLALTADEVITRAKAKGVKAPDDAIRTTVHTLRKRLKKKASVLAAPKPAVATASPPKKPAPAAKPGVAAKPARKAASAPKAAPPPKPVAAAAQRTAAPSASSAVRAILSADLDLPADAVIARAKARGVTAPDASIRNAVHNVRSELKRDAAKPATAATVAAGPPPAPAARTATPPPGADVAGVLANVAQVHAAVAACGGVEQARQVAEAVRACGGAEAFGKYLDLVAGIRAPGTGA